VQYNADILLNVKYNERSLDRVATTVARVQTLAKQLKPINLFSPGAGAGADKVSVAMENILARAKAIAGEQGKGATQISATYAGAAQTADAFAEVLRNVKIKAKDGNVELKNQEQRVQDVATAYGRAAAKADVLRDRYEALIQAARQQAGLPIGPVSQLGTVEADAAAAQARAQSTYQQQINKNLRTDVLYQKIKLNLILDQTDALLKQDGLFARLAKKASQSGGAGAFGENLALGVGFPLLFGGGAGSVAGSAIGSLFGKGFGGQILGGALGQALDQAVAAAARLANTLATVGDNFSQIREEGIYFTAELEKQVRAAKEIGNVSEARRLTTAAVTAQTGDVGGLAGQGAAAAVNELQKAWNGVTKAVGTTLGIIAGPFIFALNVVLRGVQGIFFLINGVATGIANLINLIPGAKQLGNALYELSLKGTAEYENQLAELDKQIKAEYNLVQLAKVRTGYLEQMLGKSKTQQDILGKQADATERLKKFEQEIKEFRAGAPNGTSELRKKALEQETQMRLKFAENEKQILLKDANEVYNTIRENNKRVAEAQRTYDEQRRDMVREAARAQADFDLQAIRRVEDARMKMREQELDYVQKVRQEELKTQQLIDRERQLQRSVAGALSADPEQAEIINTVQTAVENYRTGRMAVEEEARAAQEKAQLEYSKVQVQIERYKYDNALRINRANEDSQIKIAKINDQIRRQNEEASKQEFNRQQAAITARVKEQITAARVQYFPAKAALAQEAAVPGTLTPADKQYYTDIKNTASIMLGEFLALYKEIGAMFRTVQATKLQPMTQTPGLTDTSGAASAAETAANKQLLVYQQQIQQLQKINGLKKEELALAEAVLAPGVDSLKQFNDIIKQQKDRAAYEREYGALLRDGIKPELAEQLAVINQMEKAQLSLLDNMIKTIEALNDPQFKDLVDALKKIQEGVKGKAQEARGGVTGTAPGQRIQEFISRTKAELEDLEALAIRVADGIGNAVGNSLASGITGLIEGTTTAKQIFADFLKSVGDILIQEGTRMIAMYIAIGIAKAFAGLSSGGGGGGADAIPSTGNPAAPSINGFDTGMNAALAAEGAYWSGGFQAFANGGMVTRPTMGLVGEGGEPEYIIPASKMRGAMDRYAAGARGASVIPGSGGATESGGAGAPVATAPIDVRYTVERINNVDYVTAAEFQQGMRQAAEQGALRGEQRTLANIRQNTTTRRRLGL